MPFGELGTGSLILLLFCLLVACGFEFVNGFHDTANAVATVIYTKSLKPWIAVIWSGLWNFLGVFVGGIAVAMSIISLLPTDLLVANGVGAGLAMILALLVAAILWNLGTWYFGLPASSSHTLIGAILGVGLANSFLPNHILGSGVNWGKAWDVALSLVVSPLVGFTLAAFLLWVTKHFIRDQKLFVAPKGDDPPPWWVRGVLILTCTGVSFAHGSNDGQKGVGLIMLILIAIVPGQFALNMACQPKQISQSVKATQEIASLLQRNTPPPVQLAGYFPGQPNKTLVNSRPEQELQNELAAIQTTLNGKNSLQEVPKEERWKIRKNVLLIDDSIKKLEKNGMLRLSAEEMKQLKEYRSQLRHLTDYAPSWVLIVVALSLGIGTMIGWERIVVTVGAKIGKDHLNYAQGASAELVAMSTIGIAAFSGLPVSTTHVLSSGVAGTMVAQKSGLQVNTVKKIASAWVLTLPVSMMLAGTLFLVFHAMLP